MNEAVESYSQAITLSITARCCRHLVVYYENRAEALRAGGREVEASVDEKQALAIEQAIQQRKAQNKRKRENSKENEVGRVSPEEYRAKKLSRELNRLKGHVGTGEKYYRAGEEPPPTTTKSASKRHQPAMGNRAQRVAALEAFYTKWNPKKSKQAAKVHDSYHFVKLCEQLLKR